MTVRRTRFLLLVAVPVLSACVALLSCRAGFYRKNADKVAKKIIDQKQMAALGRTEPLLVESPADTLRRRLMLAQDVPYSDPASLGVKGLKPIKHWPHDSYLDPAKSPPGQPLPLIDRDALCLTLVDALQAAAYNSREYQTQKELVFTSALGLDLERNRFRTVITAAGQTQYQEDRAGKNTPVGVVKTLDSTGLLTASQLFKSGVSVTGAIGMDLARMLSPVKGESKSIFADASITVPLLRGAGSYIVAEPLTQAERNTIYAIWTFERFKGTFAVDIASNYLSVLQSVDQVKNAEENYRALVASARNARRRADAGQLPEIQVDQAVQDELQARLTWVTARQTQDRVLDAFKARLGLPPDVLLDLDGGDLERLRQEMSRILLPKAPQAGSQPASAPASYPSADAPIVLRVPGRENAGPYEIEEGVALPLALQKRLDLKVSLGGVNDAMRGVTVAADALRPELTFLGTADQIGQRRSGSGASLPDASSLSDLDLNHARYTGLLSIDLPIERTAQKLAYRQSLVNLEKAARTFQQTEDLVKSDIRNDLRDLLEFRESVQIQARSVELAQKRVRSTTMFLEAGRAEVRDVLDAQAALLAAQNGFTSAVVNYRVAELKLESDMGVLQVDEKGLWKEYIPEQTAAASRPASAPAVAQPESGSPKFAAPSAAASKAASGGTKEKQ